MNCYFCEQSRTKALVFPDGGVAVCQDCMEHVGLYELLELLGIPTLADLLCRYGIARHHSEDHPERRRSAI